MWSGKTGVFKFSDDAIAKIELASYGVAQTYPGFRVTILNKREGHVDAMFFKFDDHLDASLESRTDRRRDYPVGGNTCFKVLSHVGWDWYIAKPKSTVAFRDAVESYIKMFA